MDLNVMSIAELLQVCKVVVNKANKKILWDKIVMKLVEENFKTWGDHLCENLKEIAAEIYEKNTLTVFQRLFQGKFKTRNIYHIKILI